MSCNLSKDCDYGNVCVMETETDGKCVSNYNIPRNLLPYNFQGFLVYATPEVLEKIKRMDVKSENYIVSIFLEIMKRKILYVETDSSLKERVFKILEFIGDANIWFERQESENLLECFVRNSSLEIIKILLENLTDVLKSMAEYEVESEKPLEWYFYKFLFENPNLSLEFLSSFDSPEKFIIRENMREHFDGFTLDEIYIMASRFNPRITLEFVIRHALAETNRSGNFDMGLKPIGERTMMKSYLENIEFINGLDVFDKRQFYAGFSKVVSWKFAKNNEIMTNGKLVWDYYQILKRFPKIPYQELEEYYLKLDDDNRYNFMKGFCCHPSVNLEKMRDSDLPFTRNDYFLLKNPNITLDFLVNKPDWFPIVLNGLNFHWFAENPSLTPSQLDAHPIFYDYVHTWIDDYFNNPNFKWEFFYRFVRMLSGDDIFNCLKNPERIETLLLEKHKKVLTRPFQQELQIKTFGNLPRRFWNMDEEEKQEFLLEIGGGTRENRGNTQENREFFLNKENWEKTLENMGIKKSKKSNFPERSSPDFKEQWRKVYGGNSDFNFLGL